MQFACHAGRTLHSNTFPQLPQHTTASNSMQTRPTINYCNGVCCMLLLLLQAGVGAAEWCTAGVFHLLGGCGGLPGIHVHVLVGHWQQPPDMDHHG
jgi:hypothetical protein